MRPPLAIHVCWFPSPGLDPACPAIARELYEFLHRPLADDPVQRPGLEIPVEYGRELGALIDGLERDAEPPVGARVVVVLLDAAAYGAPVDRETMKRALRRWSDGIWSDATRYEVLVPVVLEPRWDAELPPSARRLVRAVNVDDPLRDPANRRWRLAADIAVVAGRALARSVAGPSPPTPRVFISYTNADQGARLARELAEHLQSRSRISAWFDPFEMDRGDALIRQLEEDPRHGVVLVVRTDRYSDSPWCGLELLAAKQARAPIVTLLAAEDGESWTSAYGGNHRTMAWKPGRAWEVVGRCVQAWLHGQHFDRQAAEALAHAGLPCDAEILARRPELLDLATPHAAGASRIIVYPDPPLTEGEAALLRVAQPSFRLMTPSTMVGRVLLANDPSPPLADRTVAISLSHGEDLPRLADDVVGRGLTREHRRDALSAIVLTTLHSGARMAFGGSLDEEENNAAVLADLHRSRRRLGTGQHSQLSLYVDDAAAAAAGAGDPMIEHWPVRVAAPAGAERHPRAVRDALWRMAMRHQMTIDSDGRIALGGQMIPAAGDGAPRGYRGAWPGVLEECARCLRAGKALYLLGGYGGLTDVLVRMLLDDRVPAALTAAALGEHQRAFAAALDAARGELAAAGVEPELLLADAGGLAGIERLADDVLTRWRRFRGGDRTAWRNGLTVEENLRLFRATDRIEISQLVFAGLRAATHRPRGDLSVSLYHGDLATVSNVDGYALAAVFELPPSGAMASLDAAMSGRLGRRLTGGVGEVAGVSTETDSLAGRHVLVARLALPPPGSPVAAEAIEALAAAVAARADAVGLESLAVAPFGTSMGVAAEVAVHAMLRGFRRGRGRFPRSLVVCEIDRARYQAVRDDLMAHGERFRALREGARPRVVCDTVLLLVDAHHDAATGEMIARCAAHEPDRGHAVVPSHSARMSRADWQVLRSRPVHFDNAVAKGQALCDRLLSPAIGDVLARNAGRRVMLIADEEASGLPWELLEAPDGRRPAIDGGLVRRIKLAGLARAVPDRASTDGFVRVLLVVDPLGDLHAAAEEGDAVVAALAERANVLVTRIDGGDATRARLQETLGTGDYDILHYAGHAFFDERARERSGLRLAGGETFTATDLASSKVPRVVILSACESARVRGATPGNDPDLDGAALAEAILRAGVTTLVGTFYTVTDRAALAFATALYESLVAARTIGNATRDACRRLHDRRNTDWGSFLLYGDDTLIL